MEKEKSGIVILDKCEGITSQTAVNKVKRLFGVKTAGHTGTLDPFATGVLPILVGRAVKASEYMLTAEKHYIATLLLGVTTDTEDITGKVICECDSIPTEEEVLSACSSMVGEIMQTPPMYSAIKIDGKRLMELAREGKTVERQARPVTVYSLSAKRLSEREYTLDVECSKGTYIRTLCADIGKKLGCGGVMSTLRRAEAAGFWLSDSHTLSELEKMTQEQRDACIIPVEEIFKKYEIVRLPSFFSRLAHNGARIYQNKIGTHYKLGERVRLYGDEGFFALGEVREYENKETAIKPIKSF